MRIWTCRSSTALVTALGAALFVAAARVIALALDVKACLSRMDDSTYPGSPAYTPIEEWEDLDLLALMNEAGLNSQIEME